MLDGVLAQKLSREIMKQLGYNINIMNDRGIIIASGDPKRIGDFHEIAYKIIQENMDISIAQEINVGIGIKAPGVNMPIVYENQTIGVVGISGNPDEIRSFARLVKLAVETMLEHEFYKERMRRKQTNKNTFLNALLYEEPINCNKIEKLAMELHYEEKHYRVPIIIKLSSPYGAGEVLTQIKNMPSHSTQDISFEISKDKLVVFKAVFQDPVITFKKKVLEYAAAINNLFTDNKGAGKCFYYAGTLQKGYVNYRPAYHHAAWLENILKDNAGIGFFNNHVSEYLQELVSADVCGDLFSAYREKLATVGKDIYIDTVEAFYRNNLNVGDTAKALYLHRNTVLFRLKKIWQFIGLNPLSNACDSRLLFHILYDYKKKKAF